MSWLIVHNNELVKWEWFNKLSWLKVGSHLCSRQEKQKSDGDWFNETGPGSNQLDAVSVVVKSWFTLFFRAEETVDEDWLNKTCSNQLEAWLNKIGVGSVSLDCHGCTVSWIFREGVKNLKCLWHGWALNEAILELVNFKLNIKIHSSTWLACLKKKRKLIWNKGSFATKCQKFLHK